MRLRLLVTAAVVAWSASCTSVAPVSIHAGDQCFRCRRIIIETKLAGELMDSNRFASKFRTAGCLAKYLADHPAETASTFVTDYSSGKLVAPEKAFFVPVVISRDTGERDYQAYRMKSDADAAAREFKSEVVDWTTVLTRARS